MTHSPKKIIVVAGPTAVGKTSYAIHLAQKYDAEIFSADSRQIYKEMNIGTAKPNAAELAEVQHHFIGTVSVEESYTAGQYERDMEVALAQYFEQKEVAIICGGTGLYIDAVLYGLDSFPDVPAGVRGQLNEEIESGGFDLLQKELEKSDPDYFREVDIHNPRRVVRALEVIRHTGRPYSSFRTRIKKELPYEVECIQLVRDRAVLYSRVEERVDQMMGEGLLEEVRALLAYRHLSALQTVGYSELFSHLDGTLTLVAAVDLIKQNSRRYAKRQLTWFRKREEFKVVHL